MKLRIAKTSYIISSALMIATGIMFIIFPDVSVNVIGRILGAIIAFTGLAKLFGYFSDGFYNIAFQFDFSLGIITTAVGVVFIIFPKIIAAYITAIIAVLVIVNAIFTVQNSMEAKKFGIKTWWTLLLGAIPPMVIGALALINPFESSLVLMTFIGIAVILDGIQNLIVAVIAVKVRNNG